MSLLEQVAITTAISLVLLLILVVVVIGPVRAATAVREWRPRLRAVFPYLLVMSVILLARAISQDHAEALTWVLDFDLTSIIFSIEGSFIGTVQTIANPTLSAYLGFMYLYGYVVLIAFPAIAYFALPRMQYLKELLAAYIVNDVVGIALYVMFISYGPRNLGRGLAEPILYDIYPEAALLTGSVNIPINVFPSLHTSMAATVMFFAWRTRQIYPIWAVVATVYAVSVIFSTMYLGIHWALDAVAGLLLAVGALVVGIYVVRHEGAFRGGLRRMRTSLT